MDYTLKAVKYNCYYNRIVKTEEETDDDPYIEYGVYFNPGDGVNTTVVLNDLIPDKDYIFAENNETDDVTHWFIIDARYELNGQVTVTLRRDLIRDFLPSVLTSRAFIEKGYVQSENPLIFNREDMTFNQIKKAEILIKDGTGMPWIVGYYPSKNGEGKPFIMSGSTDLQNIEYDVAVASTFDAWKYSKHFKQGSMAGDPDIVDFNGYYQVGSTKSRIWTRPTNIGIESNVNQVSTLPTGIALASFENLNIATLKRVFKDNYIKYRELFEKEYQGMTYTELQDILSYNNKYVRFSDGKIYYLKVDKSDYKGDTFYNATKELSLDATVATDIRKTGMTVSAEGAWIQVTYNYDTYTCSYSLVSGGLYTYSIKDTRYTLQDAPYSMFAIPYGSMSIQLGDGFRTDKDIALAVATDMAKTTGQVYDIQILPYCPIPDITSNSYSPTDERAYDLIKKGEENVGIIFHARKSSFSKKIPITSLVSGSIPSWLLAKTDPIEVKVQDQAEMIRFNSPNYASSWEMSVAKNKGIGYINIAATYLPYNPYIKVYPDFKGMYGGDFNDNRGLILQGDFSIPVVTDQWTTYQLQNKNYENVFNREIKNLEVQQKIGRVQDILGAITGALGAAGTGAIMGSGAGPIGTVIGGILAGGASAAAGIGDIAINDMLRDEAKSLKEDLYGYSLGNIKALPNTLSKTTAYTVDNKYFPFIELYEASDVEKEALRSKIQYSGATVGAIDALSNYIGGSELCYIKAKLIRLEGLGDQHLVNQIANELSKGVYIDDSASV